MTGSGSNRGEGGGQNGGEKNFGAKSSLRSLFARPGEGNQEVTNKCGGTSGEESLGHRITVKIRTWQRRAKRPDLSFLSLSPVEGVSHEPSLNGARYGPTDVIVD